MSGKYLGKIQVKKPGYSHTLSDYAEHRKCDRSLISKWLKAGRLTQKSAYKTYHDGIWHIHPAYADLELDGKPVPDAGAEQQRVEPIIGDEDEDVEGEMLYPQRRDSQAKREYYLACQAKFKTQTLEGTLVLATDAEKILFDVGREIREGLFTLPSRITDAILLMPERDKDRRFKILTLLEREINECLTALSDRSEGEGDK